MKVIKRNGSKVDFDKNKIIKAINKAFIEVDGKLYENETAMDIADDIEKIARSVDSLSIEEIQNLVETYLMDSERTDVARAYIRYRYKREIGRTYSTDLVKTITEKLSGNKIENANANVDEASFGGRKGAAANEVLKQYALDYCMSPKTKKNHLENRIYVHDLDSYATGMHNCLSIPFDELLANGFNTRQTDVRPANSISTAFQLVAVIFQAQSLVQFGGCSATHLDWTMVPYVKKSFKKHFLDGIKFLYEGLYFDKYDGLYDEGTSIEDDFYKSFPKAYQYAVEMTQKELHQAVEGMYHNLNTLQSRAGDQLPFTSINYGSCTLPEGRMVIKELLNVSIEGLGRLHRTSIFPCGIFQVGEGINKHPGDPNYDLFQLALKSTSLRLYPNYANLDWSGNKGYDPNDPTTYFSTMGLVA